MTEHNAPPAVLILAGLDPSGGAGLCADIQAVTAAGAHPMPVATLTTAQSLRRVASVNPLTPAHVTEQIEVALEDITPAAVKIGALGDTSVASTIADVLTRTLPDVPVVLDPVLVATSGDALGEASLPQIMREVLLPITTLATPNEDELNALTNGTTATQRADALITAGADYVLATGLAGRAHNQIEDVLFDRHGETLRLPSARLPGEFHGSGCTLSAYCAARLAQGLALPQAVRTAHADAATALKNALSFGYDVRVPARRG